MSTSVSEKAKKVKTSSTLAITAAAKAMKAQGIDVASFGAGEPDFPTPENICNAAIKAIHDGFTKYTAAAGTDDLRAAVAKKFRDVNGLDYKPSQVVVSNGGKGSLTNVFEAILNEGDEVIIPAPFWLSYPQLVQLADGVPVYVRCSKENDYKITAEQLAAACTEKTKALVLNTPNNPTGAIYSEEELRAIGRVAVEKDFFIVADEMYEALVYDGKKHVSIAALDPAFYDRTITCSGFSKSYAMTGWRLGYCGAPQQVATLIANIQSHQASNPNSIAQVAAVEALNGPQDTIAVMHDAFEKRRDLIYSRVAAMPHVNAMKPEGAFYLFVDLSDVIGREYKGKILESAADIASVLIEDYKVAVVPCADFGFDDHMRLSYATSEEEINKGLDRIEEFLKQF